MITANFCARLLKATGLAQILITLRERPAGGLAGEVAAFQAQYWREGGGVQLQHASGVSGQGDRHILRSDVDNLWEVS